MGHNADTGLKTYWNRNDGELSISNEEGDDISLEFILLHELGHALGLSHATDQKDFMYPQPNKMNKKNFEKFSSLTQMNFDGCVKAKSGFLTSIQTVKVLKLFNTTFLTENKNCEYKHVYGFGLQ